MAREHAARHRILVLRLPAEHRHDWPQRQRRVGHAPGHNHVGARRVGGRDRIGPEIRIGADDVGSELRHRLACFGEDRVGGAHQIDDVVAGHRRDLETDAALARKPRDYARAVERRSAARIGDELRPALCHRGQQHLESPCEIVPVAAAPLALGDLQQRERALRERLEHQHVDVAALDQLERRIDTIVRKPRAAANADRARLALLHVSYP